MIVDNCIAHAVYMQARGQGQRGMRAVAHVIRNRVKSKKFPNTACGVVHQRGQFTFNKRVRPRGVSWTRAKRIANNPGYDNTKGALYFHSSRIRKPWKGLSLTVKIGRHIFYR